MSDFRFYINFWSYMRIVSSLDLYKEIYKNRYSKYNKMLIKKVYIEITSLQLFYYISYIDDIVIIKYNIFFLFLQKYIEIRNVVNWCKNYILYKYCFKQ